MAGESPIDVTFDVRSDARGKDPDSHSATLRRYHQLLWSKPLPNGVVFDLDAKLHHRSQLGEFWLSSDAITHTYSSWGRPRRLVDVIRAAPQDEVQRFYDLGCTIGAYLVFPAARQVEGRWTRTINQARGIHPRIRDRFDLTLECIRLHYLSEPSPLAPFLDTYGDFFRVFVDFSGYVDFFLLQDLLLSDGSVRFHLPFEGFDADPLPASSVEAYRAYMRRSVAFIESRNRRIAAYAANIGP